MRRLLIYLTYDKQNIIDDYVGYFLHSIHTIVETLVVVCNMPKIEKGLYNLSAYADEIIYRENIGLDAGGFKDALSTYIGWERLEDYDEVILANDSFYGPFADIVGIFDKMESRNLDFWGLMKRGPGEYGTTGKDPEHILSFFYVFQSPLLHSREFRDYWKQMPYYRDYMEVVKKYERQLTSHFASLGYRYDAYADTKINESKNPRNQFFQCDYLSYEMMTKRNFPFLKRKQLSYNTLYYQTQENPVLSLDYIENQTDYDINLIWKNLIRTQHPTQLQRSLALQYILEDAPGIFRSEGQDVLVCVSAKWENAVDTVCDYLERIKDVCSIRIFADSESVACHYRERGLPAVLSLADNVEILQTLGTREYRYICMIHDADLSSEQIPSCMGKSFFLNIWENLLKNAGHIRAVINLLESKPYLGVLMPPPPVFGKWIGEIDFRWDEKYPEVREHLSRLDIQAVTDPQIPPVNVTDNFWIRTEVVDFLMERIRVSGYKERLQDQTSRYLWNYIAQGGGYLTGVVESSFYASMNETNYQYYLRTLIGWMTKRYGFHQKLHEFEEIFCVQSAVERCRAQYRRWYVYGTGEIAERCFVWLQETVAFVVSDGVSRKQTFHGKPVLYLSELDPAEEFGIVLCLSKENQDDVVRLLEEKGMKNYYTIH